MKTLDKSQQTDLFQTELDAMSSQEDFPAKTSPFQEIRLELKAKEVGYGLSAPVFLGTFDQNTPSLKTSQTCLTEEMELGLSEFCGTFPKSGTMQSGTVYELQTLARPTGGNESGSFVSKTTHQWPTPTAMTGGTGVAPSHENGGHGWNIGAAVNDSLSDKPKRQWPTPSTRDYKGGYRTESIIRKDGKSRAFDQLPNAVIDGKGTEKVSGQLNPAWVEWLMGFPIFHTDLNA